MSTSWIRKQSDVVAPPAPNDSVQRRVTPTHKLVHAMWQADSMQTGLVGTLAPTPWAQTAEPPNIPNIQKWQTGALDNNCEGVTHLP